MLRTTAQRPSSTAVGYSSATPDGCQFPSNRRLPRAVLDNSDTEVKHSPPPVPSSQTAQTWQIAG